MDPSVRQTELAAYVSPEHYLHLERAAEEKHEYFEGEVRATAGAGFMHNVLCANLAGEISKRMRGKNCAVVGSNQRLQVLNGSAYVYPDLTVVCGQPEFNEEKIFDTLLNPTLLVEVLSESTTDKDRSEKFMLYRQIPSLQQYLMLDSRTCLAELYTRQPNGNWLFAETRDLTAILDLGSIDCQVPLAEVYPGLDGF